MVQVVRRSELELCCERLHFFAFYLLFKLEWCIREEHCYCEAMQSFSRQKVRDLCVTLSHFHVVEVHVLEQARKSQSRSRVSFQMHLKMLSRHAMTSKETSFA